MNNTLKTALKYIGEGFAITLVILIMSDKMPSMIKIISFFVSVTVVLVILDAFTPVISQKGRGPTPMPQHYYKDRKGDRKEGMDDQEAIEYYSKYNPTKCNKTAMPGIIASMFKF